MTKPTTKKPITKRMLDAELPGEKDRFIWDGDISGFGVKITPADRKVFIFEYRFAASGGKAAASKTRITLGNYGAITVKQAGDRAKELTAMIVQGIDPRQRERDEIAARLAAESEAKERARLDSELAFDAYAQRFLVEYEEDHRPSSVNLARLVIDSYLTPGLGDTPLPKITRADLLRVLGGIKRKPMRRQVFAYASILFGWAYKRGEIAENPVASLPKPPAAPSRDRVLTDPELVILWHASAALTDPFGSYIRLLVLTAQRRDEVAKMNWIELDRATATWTLPKERAKNGSTHIVPLSEMAVAEIDRLAGGDDWPKAGPVLLTSKRVAINSFSKTKEALDAAITKLLEGEPMTPWRVHDLRRTVATGLRRLRFTSEVTEAVLNHISGSRAGIVGVYQLHDLADDKRAALNAWAAFVAGLIDPSPATSNVVPISKKSG